MLGEICKDVAAEPVLLPLKMQKKSEKNCRELNFLVKKCCLRGSKCAENEIFSSRNNVYEVITMSKMKFPHQEMLSTR